MGERREVAGAPYWNVTKFELNHIYNGKPNEYFVRGAAGEEVRLNTRRVGAFAELEAIAAALNALPEYAVRA